MRELCDKTLSVVAAPPNYFFISIIKIIAILLNTHLVSRLLLLQTSDAQLYV